MEFGVSPLSIVPIRKEPSDSSEQISQLLFGEYFRILKKEEKWWNVQLLYDEYEGWIDAKQGVILSNIPENSISKPEAMVFDMCSGATVGSDQIPLVLGAQLDSFDGMHFRLAKKKGFYNGQVVYPGQNGLSIELIEKISSRYMNAPYLWGGRTPFGIDCSGFTQMVFKFLGIRLRRDAYQQEEQGTAIDWLSEARKGDLAFFDNQEGRITHVGILLSPEKIIHASGKVRIDKIDNYGIFRAEDKSYSHKLKSIKRISH